MISIVSLLPDGFGTGVFAALLAASFVTSFITVALGIGGGALLIAILASLVPPAALIPVHGVVQLGSNAGRFALMRRSVVWAALPGFAAGSIIGVALGGVIAVEIPPGFVLIGVGLFVIWSVFARPPHWLRRWPAISGGVSSFLTMFFGATGPFVASFTKSLALDRHRHVATHAALMTIQHALKVLIFGLLGFAFSDWALVIVGMIATGLAGTFSGRLVLNRITDRGFKRALDILLVLISLRLMWTGYSSL